MKVDPGGNASWFEDEDALVSAIRRRDVVRPPVPVIPGCDELHEIARGGQGVVYRALHQASGRTVAVKVLRTDQFASAADFNRFEREIEFATRLDHENIVSVHDSGVTADGRRYLLMDFVEGEPLDEHVLGPDRARAPDPTHRPLEAVLRLFVRVCDAVHHAHLRGVIHRDLKPGNVRVDTSGAPHVLDFGMARPVELDDAGAASRATLTGQFVGSLAWASPEQIDPALGGVDVRSDVYALGVILYHLLTGRFPYGVDGPLRDVVDNITSAAPLPPARHRALPEDTGTIALRCLAKDPGRRYQSAGELARDVRRFLAGEPIEARRDGAWRRMQQTVRRYRLAVFGGGAAMIVLAVLLVVIAVLYGQARRAETDAKTQLDEATRQTERALAAIGFLQRVLTDVEPSDESEPTVRLALDGAVQRMWTIRDEPEVYATVGFTIGRAYYQLGRYDEAEGVLEDAISASRAHLRAGGGADPLTHQALAQSLHKLGLVRHAAWRLEDAEDLYRQAIVHLNEANDRGLRVQILVDLGTVYGAMGDFDRARHELERAVDLARFLRSDDRVGMALDKLARVRQAQGDFDAADELYEQALAAFDAARAGNSLVALEAQLGLASLRVEQHRPDEAARISKHVLDEYVARVGPDHDRCAHPLRLLSDAYRQRREFEASARYIEQAVTLLEKHHGPEYPYLMSLLFRRGRAYQTLTRLDEAIADYRRAIALSSATGRPEQPEITRARARLGCCLAAIGETDDARAVLLEALPALERHFGPRSAQTIAARACLEQLGE